MRERVPALEGLGPGDGQATLDDLADHGIDRLEILAQQPVHCSGALCDQ
jgi:hypothetical protein